MLEAILIVGAACILGLVAIVVMSIVCLSATVRAAVREDWDRK